MNITHPPHMKRLILTCFSLTFRLMVILCMHKQTHEEKKLAVSMSQSMLSFLIPQLDTGNEDVNVRNPVDANPCVAK